ncbi:neurochondrin isoform X2 [Mangifera indica]|uniref:neurochondrin isoform X2 n=1 Tax=Mangifera indica TaxID=29780 RepID=UPI001CFC04AC|nr:neurochondrin isoform X2 [Mangifera indica]XP_044464228.1 neurochondrin isoform X2 [Mangifera indica]
MDLQTQPEQSQSHSHSPSLEDCLKLLKGERDEQRLAGLLLVTKFCKGDDVVSLRKVHDAVGVRFLDRLLRTGLGTGSNSNSVDSNRDAYLQLSVTVLAAFCRVPEIASSEDMVAKIPFIVEIMSKEPGASVIEECFEFLYLVTTASGDGVTTLYECGGMRVLVFQMSTLPDGSHPMEVAIKLVQLILSKLSLEIIMNDHLSELSMMVVTIARQFAILHSALKFDSLHLLVAIISSHYSALFHDPLRVLPERNWSMYMHVGIVAILQNRVAPAEKLQALILAESMVSIMGEEWLITKIELPDIQDSIPADRCLLLVLESARVEIAVLLNELAYLKYEAPKNTSTTSESFLLKQRNLAVAFSLVEKIIKLISNIGENQGDSINENTFTKVINGLDETIGVVLEYLQDAKEHGQKKGNDLLASVRLVGSYLAETPVACKEKVRELLQYMLLVEGEDEPSPFYSICFLLPMLCQTTMNIEGCKALVSYGVYKAVVECLIKLIGPGCNVVENNDCIFLACDTILNLLLKKEQVQFPVDDSTLHLLKALAYWTDNTNDTSIIVMASSICALIFDMTSEEALVKNPNFDNNSLNRLSKLIATSLASRGQDKSDAAKADTDLLEIVMAGYSRWAHRFPCIRERVER